jgi:hypothetical protein
VITVNQPVFIGIFALICLPIVVGLIMSLAGLSTPFVSNSSNPKLIRWGLAIMFTGLAVFFCTAFVNKKSAIIDQSGAVVKSFPKNTIMWTWKYMAIFKGKNAHLAYYGEHHGQVAMGIHLIVGDPNVRSLTIQVLAKTHSNPNDMIKLEKATGNVPSRVLFNADDRGYDPLEQRVKSLLFEFSEKHGDELKPFYNPLDHDQQARFKKLMEDNLNAPLAEAGAYVADAAFNVEN